MSHSCVRSSALKATARSALTAPSGSLNSTLGHWRGIGTGDRCSSWSGRGGRGGFLFGLGKSCQSRLDARRLFRMRQEDDDRRAGPIVMEPDDPIMPRSICLAQTDEQITVLVDDA